MPKLPRIVKFALAGVLLGGIAEPTLFLLAGRFITLTVSIVNRNEYFIPLNAIMVTFWPSSIFSMWDPATDWNWQLIGLASLANALLYAILGLLLALLTHSFRMLLIFWSIASIIAICSSWFLAGESWPAVIVGVIAAVHIKARKSMVDSKKRSIEDR